MNNKMITEIFRRQKNRYYLAKSVLFFSIQVN